MRAQFLNGESEEFYLLSGSAIAAITAFVAAIFLTLRTLRVRVPFTSKSIHVDYGLAPLLCAFALLAVPTLPALTLLKSGILGCSYIKPYSVIIFILSLSYICISLDCTGFFEYISLRVIKTAGNSGFRLFTCLFLLTSFMTMFTSNDVVILTVTYIVLYMSMHAGIDPFPFLLAQFFAANIISMGLYVGNPTNIVIADAFNMTFIEFARWMLIPSVIATFTCLTLLIFTFRNRIPKRIKLPNFVPKCSLKDRKGAIFGLLMLGCMLFLISLPTEWTNSQPWTIALFFAILMALYDLTFARSRLQTVIRKMPWKIAPFLIGLFIIVEGLAASGWTSLLASTVLHNVLMDAFTAVLSLSFLSAVAASVMNNHPMTVFFVKTLKENIASQLSDTTRVGVTSALVVGSNLGANYMLTGSIAGLMWSKILSDKGIKISFFEFSKYGFTIIPLVTLATSLSLAMMLTI